MKLLSIKHIIVLLICLFSINIAAQNDGLSPWLTMKVGHKFSDKLSSSVVAESRFDNYFKNLDRLGLGFNLDYRLLSFLKIEGGYEVHFRDKGTSGLKFRQRYGIGATASTTLYMFKLSLRERFQQTFENGDVQSNLRSRLKIAYAPRKSIITPYFSFELYQPVGHASFWSIDRTRYRPGIEIELNKAWALDVFYCHQHTSKSNKNILGIDCSFTF